MEKSIPEPEAKFMCVCVCVWEREKKLQFLRYIKNVFKKDFKIAELLTKTSFFFYFRDRSKNGEGNKLRKRSKYMR